MLWHSELLAGHDTGRLTFFLFNARYVIMLYPYNKRGGGILNVIR